MHFSTISGAAVLLALAPSTLAAGVATLVNACGYDIFYAPTSGSEWSGMVSLPPGGSYSLPYADPGQGTSIKVSPADDLSGPITQLEFTWADGKINYDISNINGNPFMANGMVLTPSMSNDPNNPSCVPVDCPAGDGTCTAAYNQPDDTATKVCSDAASLTMVVCAGSAKFKRDPVSSPAAPMIHEHHRHHTRQFPRK